MESAGASEQGVSQIYPASHTVSGGSPVVVEQDERVPQRLNKSY